MCVSEVNGRGRMLLVTLVVAALGCVNGASAQAERDNAVQADEAPTSQAVQEEADTAVDEPIQSDKEVRREGEG